MIKKHGQIYLGKILIVEDELDLREVLRMDLEDAGHEVFEAVSGNEALDILQREHIDLVISDIRMNDGSGLDLLENVKKLNPASPMVMFLSGQTLSKAEAQKLGAVGIINKPWQADTVRSQIQTFLQNCNEQKARKSPRYPVDWTVKVLFDDFKDKEFGSVANVARGGMFIKYESPKAQVGNVLWFSFETPAGKTVSGVGVVRWVRKKNIDQFPPGFGVEFLDMPTQHKDEIRGLVDSLVSG